jgi:glycosyltransferase involved in cell wall biosynthesis
MARLSVMVLTLNEERNIPECLESVRWADEIVIIDSGSGDRTVELARQFTGAIFQVEWKGYGATRNLALGKATGEWVLWLDADERVTPELAQEIRAILADDPAETAGFRIARRAYFLGRWIRHCGWYPSRVVRLFRRERAHFTETSVHERLVIDGPAKDAAHDLLHFTDPDLHHYLTKFNRYTSLAADDLQARGHRFRMFDVTLRPLFTFLKMYVFRRGFLDGIPGLILCVLSSAYVFAKYAKLWEIQFGSKSVKGG